MGGGGDENSIENIDEFSGGIAVDAAGNAYVTGGTSGSSFPTLNALQGFYGGGTSDGFIAKIAP
ncbi:MAG: SBBP repeat-containing protein [Acidobacteria bacterium]|nr:SBBP repeat-containing protein [Acidobacteriota bacterium]